ncbi:hypothetical protein ACWEGQ_09245 [Streptomyces seoulensis]
MGSLRLTVCAGLLVAGAVAPVIDTARAAGPADRADGAGHRRAAVTSSSPATGGSPTKANPTGGDPAVVPTPVRPAPSASASASAQAVPESPGTAHAVTGLVLAAVAAVAVVLLPRAVGRDRTRWTRRGTD